MRRLVSIALVWAASAAGLQAQANDPPSRVARISALQGQASLQSAGSTAWSEAALNYTVTTGDRVITEGNGRAELEIGPMTVRIAGNSDVTVTNLADRFLQLGVEQGTMRLSVYRIVAGDSIEIDTPNGALIVTTPGEYRVDIADDDSHTLVSVDAGGLTIVGPGVNQIVRGGQAVRLAGTDRIDATSVARPARTNFDQWAAERDHRDATAGCSQYMNSDIPGCADLDEAGQWEANPEYGTVWYPSRVSNDWVPYRDGHWAWIEPWGWSWVADEPWGYAPFHYGRWARFGPRWGWIPGPMGQRPYYAPALVAFVGGPGWSVGVSVGTQAWFPLGPREAYIPSYHHDDVYERRVNSANVRNVTNITAIIDVQKGGRGEYVNRGAGMTAVPTDVFRNGRAVGRDVVPVRPDDARRGMIIAHPSAAPVERATLGGRPAAHQPDVVRPPMITTAAPRGDRMRGAPSRGEGQPRYAPTPPTPVATPMPQPSQARPAARPDAPAPAPAAPSAPSAPPAQPATPSQPRGGRPIMTRTPPPPAQPPFEARTPALEQHPGRPLEPKQIENVRNGRPAGPARDAETPPHPAQPPTAEPARGRGAGGRRTPPDSGRGPARKP